MCGACSMHMTEHVYKNLVIKSLRKRPIQRPRFRYRGTNVTDLTETASDGVQWIKLVQERVQT